MSHQEVYERLSNVVGNTSLYEIKNIEIPNKCRIFCKEENTNPTGSHYDRFWVDYMQWFEYEKCRGHIDPKVPIVETSTGNSGASFAWICQALGFEDYRVVIPKDMPIARINQIRSYGAQTHFSPEGEYIQGLIDEFRKYKEELRSEYGYVYLPDHSNHGDKCLNSMGNIANEMIEQLSNNGIAKADYFVSALGNGLTTKGIGQVLKRKYKKLKIVGMEPDESPTIYLEAKHLQKPQTYGRTHGLIGTGPGNSNFLFPIINSYKDQINIFTQVKENDWKNTLKQLTTLEGKIVGHTSAACVYTALNIAKEAEEGSIILTVFYDSEWKYL